MTFIQTCNSIQNKVQGKWTIKLYWFRKSVQHPLRNLGVPVVGGLAASSTKMSQKLTLESLVIVNSTPFHNVGAHESVELHFREER